jgi:hypothetical protein
MGVGYTSCNKLEKNCAYPRVNSLRESPVHLGYVLEIWSWPTGTAVVSPKPLPFVAPLRFFLFFLPQDQRYEYHS